MNRFLLCLLLCCSSVFSQSIDLGNIGLINYFFLEEKNNELFIFYNDSLNVIDLINFKKKSNTEFPNNKFSIYEPIYNNSKIYFVERLGGKVMRLENDKVERIDNSFTHKMQISSTVFSHNDTIYRYGGYGFWSHRNFFTYFDESTSEWEIVPPTGSKELPSGSDTSIVTVINDDFYVYGGGTVNKFNPLNFIMNDEVWKFNLQQKSWNRLGTLNSDLLRDKINFRYKNDHVFLNRNENQIIRVDILNNNVKFYKISSLTRKIVLYNPIFYDGFFYCVVLKQSSNSVLELIKISEDEFFGDLIKSETLYSNNEHIYFGLGILVLISLLGFSIFKIIKWNKKKNRIILVNGHFVYKRRILNFDDKSSQIIYLLLKSDNEVKSKDIMDITENKDLNYAHNTRVMNSIIDEINFKLKETLHIKEDLISFKKSDTDKRIKVYSIIKEYFFIK